MIVDGNADQTRPRSDCASLDQQPITINQQPTTLCAACGMCCDGTLFHAVTLQPADAPRALAAHGLPIRRKQGKTWFHQPCPAHAVCRCTIYEDRPTRCRAFDCRQLLRLAAGEITPDQALTTIQSARQQATHVDDLITQLADTNPARSLAHRAANALTTDEPTPAHEELRTAFDSLEVFLNAHFRVPEE